MILILTYDQALAGLEAAVADRGEDFRYQNAYGDEQLCRNFDDRTGEPMCIAGYVYSLHGITPDDTAWGKYPVGVLRDLGLLLVDRDTEVLLSCAQHRQDCGATWGYALAVAKARVAQQA